MTLREKILKTFVVTIREINRHGGPEEFFKKYPVGGMYYMKANGPYDIDGCNMGSGMFPPVLKKCRENAPKDFLICADSTRMPGQKNIPSQRALGALNSDELAYNYGKMIGMQMNSMDIDWVLAPSMDMYMTSLMPVMAVSDDPEFIARTYRQVVRGIQDQGVLATAKHFPGLGTHNVNMHHAPGQNIFPFDKWMDTYGYTYKEVFKESPATVMTTHTTLKCYDNEIRDGYYPSATYSPKLTNNLLRDELGFKGAVVTDALIMGGNVTGDLVMDTVMAFKAGADLLLWPPIEAADKIEELINSGEIPMSRLDEAVERIDAMIEFRNKAKREHTYDEPDLDFVEKTSEDMIKSAICCLRNDIGLLPLAEDKHKSVVILDASEDDGKAARLIREELLKRGIKADISRAAYDIVSDVWWQELADNVQKDRDAVIVVIDAPYISTWGNPLRTIWGSHMIDKARKVIVNFGSPFFAPDYFPEDPTFVEMNGYVTEFAVSELVKRLYGEEEFTGHPVLKNN